MLSTTIYVEHIDPIFAVAVNIKYISIFAVAAGNSIFNIFQYLLFHPASQTARSPHCLLKLKIS